MVMEHIFHEDESFSSHQIVSLGENLRRVSGEEVHKRKRNRQVLSWQECKRRKIKCDRKLPCTSCIKRGENEKCHWEETKKEVAPQPFALVSDVQALQARLIRLESLFHQRNQIENPPCIPQTSGSASSSSHSSSNEPQSPIQPATLNIPELKGFLESPQIESLLRAVSMTNVTQKAKREQSDTAQALEDMIISLSEADASPASRPVAQISNGSLAILKDPATTTAMGRKGRMQSILEHMGSDKEAKHRAYIWSVFPKDKMTMDKIVGLYFDRFAWCHHLIHVPSWKSWYREYWILVEGGFRDEIEPCFLAVLAGVLALGMVCYVPGKDEALPGVLEEEDYAYLPIVFNTASMMALEIAKWEEAPSYFACLAFALFIPFDKSMGTGISAVGGGTQKYRIASGVRLCQQLEYNRLAQDVAAMPPDSKGLPPGSNTQKREMCLWLFHNFQWYESICSHPRIHSMRLELGIERKMILPLNCNDKELCSTTTIRRCHDDSVYTELTFDLMRIRLGVISVKIFRYIASGSMSYNHVMEIDGDYRAILQANPKELHEDYVPPPGHKEDAISQGQRLLSSELIHNRLVRLHRPFLIRGYSDTRFKSSTVACLTSARRALSLQRKMRDSGSAFVSWEFFVVHLLASSLVIIIDLFRAVEATHLNGPCTPLRRLELEQQRREVQDCVNDFRESLKTCKLFTRCLARSCLAILEELLAAEEEYRAQAKTNPALLPFEETLRVVIKKLSSKLRGRAMDDEEADTTEPMQMEEDEDPGMKLLRELGLLEPNWSSQQDSSSVTQDFTTNLGQSGMVDTETLLSSAQGTDWLLQYFGNQVNSEIPQF
ncbi:hypothetical protein BT69DRAFT_296154 [Atractiella rhizophila]|nr:hypothetical protein BT69DRAFT_296154 [Atractiella rhizophila]